MTSRDVMSCIRLGRANGKGKIPNTMEGKIDDGQDRFGCNDRDMDEVRAGREVRLNGVDCIILYGMGCGELDFGGAGM